jgi:thiamine biosynthesis lipoprotein
MAGKTPIPTLTPAPNPPGGAAHIQLDAEARRISFTRPGLSIDLGGIAKGFALDLAAQLIRDEEVERAFIHGGASTMIAIGAPPDKDGWPVALGDPRTDPVISLCDAALSVSAQHGRQAEHDGRTVGHVIDPRRGVPAQGHAAAAVIGPSAMEADAWSTAIVAGPPEYVKPPAHLTTLVAPPSPDGTLQWDSSNLDADTHR